MLNTLNTLYKPTFFFFWQKMLSFFRNSSTWTGVSRFSPFLKLTCFSLSCPPGGAMHLGLLLEDLNKHLLYVLAISLWAFSDLGIIFLIGNCWFDQIISILIFAIFLSAPFFISGKRQARKPKLQSGHGPLSLGVTTTLCYCSLGTGFQQQQGMLLILFLECLLLIAFKPMSTRPCALSWKPDLYLLIFISQFSFLFISSFPEQ